MLEEQMGELITVAESHLQAQQVGNYLLLSCFFVLLVILFCVAVTMVRECWK